MADTRVLWNDEGSQGFFESRIRHAHDPDRGDRGVGAEHILDFHWIDVLPAADHHVVTTTAKTEVTVIVHHAEITSVQPPIGGLAGKVLRGGEDLADSRRVRLVDLQTEAANRSPDGVQNVRGIQGGQAMIVWAQAGDRAALGLTTALPISSRPLTEPTSPMTAARSLRSWTAQIRSSHLIRAAEPNQFDDYFSTPLLTVSPKR